MASSKILKNLIDKFSNKLSGLINRVDPDTGERSEVRTVKAVVPGKGNIIVYDLFEDYVYSDLSATLSYANVTGKTYAAGADGKVVSPTLTYSINETERGNSGELYGTTKFTTGQSCNHTLKNARTTYSFNYADGITNDDVTVDMSTGVLTVKDRELNADYGDGNRNLGTVSMTIEWADMSVVVNSGEIYQQKNVLEEISLSLNPNPVDYNEYTLPSVTARYTSGKTIEVAGSASYESKDENIAIVNT